MPPSLLKNMIRDTNEQPDEIQWVRPGRVLSAGAPPLEVGMSPPRVETFSNLEGLFTNMAGDLCRCSPTGMINC